MDDSGIIDLYFARSEDAIVQTDAKYGAYCRAIAMNILKSREDSDECVSDTWLHAWNAMPPQRPGILSAFLGRITRNLSFDRFKAAHADKRGGGSLAASLDELAECVASRGGVDEAVDARELARLIDAFLRRLPERECNIFLRRYWFVDGIDAIALRFSMKPNTVKSVLLRTREKLRRFLQQEGISVCRVKSCSAPSGRSGTI